MRAVLLGNGGRVECAGAFGIVLPVLRQAEYADRRACAARTKIALARVEANDVRPLAASAVSVDTASLMLLPR